MSEFEHSKYTCVFCPRRADSLEDAWPNWLRDVIVTDDVNAKTHMEIPAVGKKRAWSGSRAAIRCVCRQCNSGWMSRLETFARPGLIRVALEDIGPISAGEATWMATWAAKTAMIFECCRDPDIRFCSPADYRHLKSQLTPPPGMRVFLGRLERQGANNGPLHVEAVTLSGHARHDLRIRVEGCATTMVVGSAVFQTIALRTQAQVDLSRVVLHPKRTHGDGGIRQIWPWTANSVDLAWPPPDSLESLSDIIDLANRYNDE